VSNEIFSLDITPTPAHIRKGEWVSTHCHLSVTYLFEADENEAIRIQPDENSNVKWMTFDEFLSEYHQSYIIGIYKKVVEKIKKEIKK
ncbi:MAG TPA: NUDIX hydrolase, partial [Bacilli bacterium]|nr:NUDIX hydrolase [Bacilli bacterium]